jgi:hypothetical protein
MGKRRPITRLLAVAAAVPLTVAAVALASGGDNAKPHTPSSSPPRGGGKTLFRSFLAPSQPNDPSFHDVVAGMNAWQLDRGDVRLKRNGRFRLVVRGLVLTSSGDPGAVTTVDASLYCGADSTTAPADTTDQVPISSKGDAHIRDKLTLPSTCLAPVVLVHPNGDTDHYIAVDGFR